MLRRSLRLLIVQIIIMAAIAWAFLGRAGNNQENGEHHLMGTTRLSINASIPPAGSSPKDSPEIASPSLSPVLSPSPPNYLIIIDGLIYVLQGGQPKGISVVWKNLILHLAKEFPTPNKVVFIDRIGSGLSAEIGNYPGVTATPFINNNLDSSVRSVIDQHLSRNSTHRSMIPVFLSTYYDYPWSVEGLCKIILYHDLIPENVGMHAGPGSEYYPRIEALPRVNSIVTVSDSTARDLIRLYDKDLHLVPSDPAYRLLNGSDVGTVDGEKHWWFSFGWDRVLTSIYNRISRDVFPGPSEPADIRRFREQLKLFTMDKALPYRIANQGGSSSSSNSKEDIPVDYFLTVGSDHPYKNFEPLMAAIDQLDDDLLSRVQFVMIGRGGFKDYDRGQIHRHRVIFRENGGDEQHWSPSKPVPLSTVPIRLVFGDFIAEDLLKHAYSGALALVYVSSYEGFGLPVAEAMTSGTLVLLTNSSSLPEVGGPPDISIYVQNPREPLQIKDALTRMTRLPTEERAKRIQLARRYVERFGGGGEDGRKHGWNEMASLLAKHIRDRRKHRGRDCFYE